MYRLKHILLLTMLWIALPNCLLAQRNPNHYSTEQGLSNNFVYCVFKDSRGILWAATESGLNCFNGNVWQYFDAEKGQIGDQSNDCTFVGITEDDDRNIYFCTYGQGVFVYNWDSKKVKKICKENTPQLASNQFLNAGYYNGLLYLLSTNHVNIIDTKSGKWKKTLLTSKNEKYNYLDILIDSDTINILTSGKGIQQFVDERLVNVISILQDGTSLQEMEKWRHQYFVASNNGVFVSKKNKLEKQEIFYDNKNISNEDFLGLGRQHKQFYCMSTTYGKLFIDSMIANKLYLSANPQDKQFVKEGSFISNYSDNKSNATVVGMQSGVGILKNNKSKFQHFKINGNLKSGVLCSYPLSDSIVLLGTQKGLLKYNMFNYSVKLIDNANGNNFVYDIKKVQNKIIIFCVNGNYCFEQNKITSRLPSELQLLTNFMTRQLIQINDSFFVMIELVKNKMLLLNLKNNFVEEINVLGNNINNVVLQKDVLFYSATNGLFYYDIKSKVNQEISISHPSKDFRNVHLMNNRIYAILSNAGIYEILNKVDAKLVYQMAGKIVSSAMVKDKILMTTSVNVIEHTNAQATYYTPYDGYENNDFTVLTSNVYGNKVFFGQGDGFTIFDNARPDTQAIGNQIIINDLMYYQNGAYQSYRKNNLAYNQNTLLLQLACTNYLQPDRNTIWYRINGQEWIDLGLNKQLLLNQLAPDDYKIELMLDTLLNAKTKPIIFEFTVMPPWYKTWWFRLMLALSSAGIIFFGTKYYFASELKKKQLLIEKLEAVQQERERMSADLHDDIGSHISTVQLLANKVSNNTSNEYAAEFKTTVNQLGQKIREIIWVTKSENDSLENFIAYSRQYIAKQMDLADVVLRFHQPDAIPNIGMPSAMRRDVFMCIKECINNIVKHAQAAKVEVSIGIAGNKIIITIQDDGVGLKGGNAFGNGLKQMNERLNKYGGGYEIVEEKGCRSVLMFWV
jgi:signal transduction histidine kinase